MFYNCQKIKNYDLIVVGNNLAAVVSAGIVASSGKKVALVTSSEQLLGELSEGMLGNISKNSPIYAILTDMGAEPVDFKDEVHIPMGMASKTALKYLKSKNVNILLKASPIGLLFSDEKVSGIAVATKFGAYTVKGSFVADFSDRIFYEKQNPELSDYIYAFQMGGVNVKNINTQDLSFVDLEDVCDIEIHPDCRSEDTSVISFKTSQNTTQKCIEKTLLIINYLIKNNPDFQTASLLKYALKPFCLSQGYATPQKGLLSLNMGNILSGEDYNNLLIFATDLITTFLNNAKFSEPTLLKTTYGEFDLNSIYEGKELDEFLGAELLKINTPTKGVTTLNADLFIAGLGAGGAAAMWSAISNGCNVIAAEALPTPGGTRTHGMVSAFWHGYQDGFATQNRERVNEFAKKNLGRKAPPFTAEAIYYLNEFKNSKVFYSTFVFDAVKEGNNTVAVLLSTPDGIVRVNANKFIDATGDADLAALSGTEYMSNGDERDFVTQGYSVWGDERVGTPFKDSLHKSDEDNISTESYSEFLRGIFTSHSVQSDLGFSPLLTVRESRRIKGKHILTMKDILRQVCFDDTVTVSLCLYDAHGVGTSPAYYTSIFEGLKGKGTPEVCTRIPLGSLLPAKDENLMVISKSISATRDAGCLIRMNPDIQNTGYAAGLIAANAAKNNLEFEKAYSVDIKNHLLDIKVLPDFYNTSVTTTAQELIKHIEAGEKPKIAMATAYDECLSDFENAYNGNENLGIVIAAMGSKKPFEDMLKRFNDYVTDYEENKTSATKIKTYSVLLSRLAAEDEDIKSSFLPVLKRAIEVMDAGGEYVNPEHGIYQNSKVSNRIVPNFRELMGLCVAAETVADSSLAESLLELSRKKNINLADGDEIHSVQLYLRIIAAAARCGDEKAKTELEKHVLSERLFFRQFAKSELYELKNSNKKQNPVAIMDFWI